MVADAKVEAEPEASIMMTQRKIKDRRRKVSDALASQRLEGDMTLETGSLTVRVFFPGWEKKE